MARNALLEPRIVIVTRPTRWQELVSRAATVGQARFLLEPTPGAADALEAAHQRFERSLGDVLRLIPSARRIARVTRDQLDRFQFEPEDLVMAVGQDGLVANVAKYLSGQVVAGINPDPQAIDGVLCRHCPESVPAILHWHTLSSSRLDEARHGASPYCIERRTMALATRHDGLSLLALNELFVGHCSHQSARYELHAGAAHEQQSSSGIIVATGTGCTGWACSIIAQRANPPSPVAPNEPKLLWLVREPWPSKATGTSMQSGVIEPDQHVAIRSLMPAGGIVFADGIESDALPLLEGDRLDVRVAQATLNLLVPA